MSQFVAAFYSCIKNKSLSWYVSLTSSDLIARRGCIQCNLRKNAIVSTSSTTHDSSRRQFGWEEEVPRHRHRLLRRRFFQQPACLSLIQSFVLLAAPRIDVRLVEMWTRGQDDQRGDGYRQEEYEQKDAIQDQAHLPRSDQPVLHSLNKSDCLDLFLPVSTRG